jgi:4-amino-4-deoxy-L-arabinose transferase-like glycosyltransferase
VENKGETEMGSSSAKKDHRSPGKEAALLGGILLLALILRAVLLFAAARHVDRAFFPDTQTYLDPAMKLLANGSYPADSAMRTPGYPVFIALVYWLGGPHPFLLVLAQVLVGTVNVFLTYLFGKLLLPKPAALLGALFLAVSVESITSVFYILTETLFTAFLVAAMLAWVKGYREKSFIWTGIAALSMGACVLVRPVALFFPVMAALAWLFRKGVSLPRQAAFAGLFLGLYLLTLLPWVLRNEAVLGYPTISTISADAMLFYNAASLEASLRNVSEAEIRLEYPGRISQALEAHGLADTEANRARVEESLARQILLAHPFRYLLIHLKSDLNGLLPDVTGPTEILGLTVGGKGTLSILNQSGLLAAIRNYYGRNLWLLWLTLPVVLLLGLVYLLGLVGAISLIRQNLWLAAFALLSPPFYYLLAPGAASLPRFRVPVMPFLCLLAGQGAYVLLKKIKRKGV